MRYLLDENLPARAAELMAAFGFPMLAVGGVAGLPRGSLDAEIARRCGENDAVWVTLDRGILKDREIAAAILGSKTSILLLPAKGMRMRDYLSAGYSLRPDRGGSGSGGRPRSAVPGAGRKAWRTQPN